MFIHPILDELDYIEKTEKKFSGFKLYPRALNIEYNIGLKQPEGLERNVSDLESFFFKEKIWENLARIFCLSLVMSFERTKNIVSESLQGVTRSE